MPLPGCDGDAEHQLFGAEIQSAGRLVAIQDANELEDAVVAEHPALFGPSFKGIVRVTLYRYR